MSSTFVSPDHELRGNEIDIVVLSLEIFSDWGNGTNIRRKVQEESHGLRVLQ